MGNKWGNDLDRDKSKLLLFKYITFCLWYFFFFHSFNFNGAFLSDVFLLFPFISAFFFQFGFNDWAFYFNEIFLVGSHIYPLCLIKDGSYFIHRIFKWLKKVKQTSGIYIHTMLIYISNLIMTLALVGNWIQCVFEK